MKVNLNLQSTASFLYKIFVKFLTYSHAKFHTIMCGDLLDTAFKIKLVNFIFYIYYKGIVVFMKTIKFVPNWATLVSLTSQNFT